MQRFSDFVNTFVFTKLAITILVYMSIHLGTQAYTIQGLIEDSKVSYNERLTSIVLTEGVDINLMCNAIGCNYVNYKNNNYKSNNGILKRTFEPIDYKKEYYDFNSNLEMVIEVDNIKFLVDNSRLLSIILNMIKTSSLLILLIILVSFWYKTRADIIRRNAEKTNDRVELESRLQRDITESLRHEMGPSVVIIESLIKTLFRRLYPCKLTSTGVCDFDSIEVSEKDCVGCPFKQNRRIIDSEAVNFYKEINLAIERLFSIQSVLSDSKHIKYSNGTVAIYTILDNIICNNNNFKVSKVKAKYYNKELLEKFACGKGLSNGDLLMAIHAMVVNSMEAKASVIKFKAVLESSTRMSIYMSDNGRGIRNRMGEVIKDTRIFNYGYSNKNPEGEEHIIKGVIGKIKYCLSDKKELSTRGVGLSTNKRLMEKANGDIELIDTSTEGTTFKISIPIKPRKG